MISQRENVHKLCTCRVCCYVSHFLYYCGGTWSDTPPLGHGSFRYVLTLHGTNSIQQSSGEFSSHRSGLFAQQRPAEATPIPTSSGHSFSSCTDTSYRHIIYAHQGSLGMAVFVHCLAFPSQHGSNSPSCRGDCFSSFTAQLS